MDSGMAQRSSHFDPSPLKKLVRCGHRLRCWGGWVALCWLSPLRHAVAKHWVCVCVCVCVCMQCVTFTIQCDCTRWSHILGTVGWWISDSVIRHCGEVTSTACLCSNNLDHSQRDLTLPWHIKKIYCSVIIITLMSHGANFLDFSYAISLVFTPQHFSYKEEKPAPRLFSTHKKPID